VGLNDELHRAASVWAAKRATTLDQLVHLALRRYLDVREART